jgi:hypothetical protein
MMKATAIPGWNQYNDRHRDESTTEFIAAPSTFIASFIIAQYNIAAHRTKLVSIEIIRMTL